jgi:single-strand DNA-binding protein
MRGIESAFWGVLGQDPQLKTSKTGTRFATMNVVVQAGQADHGKDVSQWLRVACFGEAAEKIAAKARKGDRVYVEGQLTLNTWADKATGETKTGLNVAAWKCEKVPGIGKNRERKAGPYQDNGYSKPKPANAGGFNDEFGFGEGGR